MTAEVSKLQQSLDTLYMLCTEFVLDQKHLPDLTKSFAPLVNTWIQEQEELFSQYVVSVLSVESWQPLEEIRKSSSSVIDLFGMIRRTFPRIFSIKLPTLLEYFLTSMIRCITRTIESYAATLLKPCANLVFSSSHSSSSSSYLFLPYWPRDLKRRKSYLLLPMMLMLCEVVWALH